MLAWPFAALVVAFALGGALPPPSSRPDAVAVIPDEPGVMVVADGQPTIQAVAADLDGDAARELVRLGVRDDGVMVADVWREDGGAWSRAAEPVVTVTNRGGQAERAFFGRPVRLLLRSVDGADRVTLVRQPDFTDVEDEIGCCLLLDDLRLEDGVLSLDSVAEPAPVADAIHAIDFDGDGTDELLLTRSLPPLGDVSYPTDARVLRWTGARFTEPVRTELPIGSGDTPFILGDTDGLPGDEAGIVSVTGRDDLYRLVLEEGDALRAEAAGLAVTDARAVPLGDRRGVAVARPRIGLAVMEWPPGEGAAEALAEAPLVDAETLGVVGVGRSSRLVVRAPDGVRSLLLPSLEGGTVPPEAGAEAALGAWPLRPYAGPLPGGGIDGRPAVIADGRLFGGGDAVRIAALPGVQPVGLVGDGSSRLALLHAPSTASVLDPAGGRLVPPAAPPTSMLTLVPRELAFSPEAAGPYAPVTAPTIPLAFGEVAVADEPFEVDVAGPPGSLVYLATLASSDVGPGRQLDASGRRRLAIQPRPDPATGDADPISVIVVTPAGHGYRADWWLRVVDGAPEIEARTVTPFGSTEVVVEGRTAAYASVRVAGASVPLDADGGFTARVALPPWPTAVTIVASDPLGHEATAVLSGVGLFDYRALPWVPMVGAAALLTGIWLYLRVPRRRSAAPPAPGDAALEELDPDDLD